MSQMCWLRVSIAVAKKCLTHDTEEKKQTTKTIAYLTTVVDRRVIILDLDLACSHIQMNGHLDLICLQDHTACEVKKEI